MLEAIELEAARGAATLFRGLGFTLRAGGLLRVTGANGSGKTSLLRALCGLILPVAGEVRWNGENVRSLREDYWKQLAYIGHANALKDDLSAAENLEFACVIAGLAPSAGDIRAALETFGLAARAHLPARALSQGQRRRTALARLAVSGGVPLWILDEPFAALDTAAAGQVRTLVAGHLARGGLAVLTSHQDFGIAAATTDVDLDFRP